MRLLVTGGAGYIGSHTTKALSRAGHDPVVLDDLSTGHRWAVRWGPFVEASCGDTMLVRQVLREYRIEGVLHFAASAYVSESIHNPQKYFQNNVSNTLGLLQAMLAEDTKYLVFSSSCATYGIPTRLPITEEQLQMPVNPYGESKLFIERVLRWYGEASGLHWMALRYFNAAGADPEGELHEEHDPETHIIPLVIGAAIGRQPYFDICGIDYPTPDGTAIRDFVHVSDLADAHVLAVEHLQNGGTSLGLNLGTGQGHSVREVVQAVSAAVGRPVCTRDMPQRHGDPPSLVADPSRAMQVLNWSSPHSALSEIIHSALQSFSLMAQSASGSR